MYFTDPGERPKPKRPIATAVYCLSPRKALPLIDHSVGLLNGVQLSPDERVLYVADTTAE